VLLIGGIQVTPSIISVFTKNPDQISEFTVSYKDLLKGIAFYVFSIVLRFALVSLMVPFSNKLGLKINFGKAALISIGNVKGGFNIVLALIAHYGLPDRKIADLILFHAVLQLILSHLINTQLVKLIVRKYQLTNDTTFDN
jgi:hypothetical protein